MVDKRKTNVYRVMNNGEDKAMWKRVHEAVVLDYIREGPGLWDQALEKAVDKRWRQVFDPKPDERIHADIQ